MVLVASTATATVANAEDCVKPTTEAKFGVMYFFEKNYKEFLRNGDEPRWDDSLNLLDALARVIAIKDSGLAAKSENLLLRFLWNEVPIMDVQNNLDALLSHCPKLRDHFAGFLDAPMKTKSQEKAAKYYLCTLTGLPFSNNIGELQC